MREGKTKEAIEYINKAIEKNISNAEAFNLRGVAYYELKEYPNALLDFNQSIKLQPDSYRPYFNRALLRTSENKTDSALVDYNTAAKLAPDTSDVFLNRGQLLVQMDKLPEAITDFEKATRLNENNKQAWYNLGNTYYRQKDFKKATLAFRQTIKLDGQYGKAFYGLGLAQWYDGEKDLGCGNFKQAASLGYADAAAALNQFCQKQFIKGS